MNLRNKGIKMSNQLCITLGHNSSCILLDEGKIICGYENERLSKIKSDSQFPKLAIEECLTYDLPLYVDKIYISHWSIDCELTSLSVKHFDPIYLALKFPDAKIHSLTKEFTHHDAHFWSAKCFAKNFKEEDIYTIVADGFGNFGETISIYYNDNLIKRVFGFDTSLGLLYQYATAYLGLKMNQDEFKLLGYGAHIEEVVSHQEYDDLTFEINIWTNKFIKSIFSLIPDPHFDPLYSLDSLPALRLKYNTLFNNVLKSLNFEVDDYTKKVIISYLVQRIVEKVILNIIQKYNMKNVILSGGLFLNVKLNNMILKIVDKLCVMPLCGDQGAALGICYKDYPNLEINDLYWGLRSVYRYQLDPEIIIIPNDRIVIKRELEPLLQKNYILNIIHGPMEYGPRALCNTSTIALPTTENVEYINKINGRDQIMPMAPVIIKPYQIFRTKDIDKVYKSLGYMVIAINYRHIFEDIEGVIHDYNGYTGRPQILSKGHILYDIVKVFGILINTSFNIHGTPVVYDEKDINKAHKEQRKLDFKNKIKTIFITD